MVVYILSYNDHKNQTKTYTLEVLYEEDVSIGEARTGGYGAVLCR